MKLINVYNAGESYEKISQFIFQLSKMSLRYGELTNRTSWMLGKQILEVIVAEAV